MYALLIYGDVSHNVSGILKFNYTNVKIALQYAHEPTETMCHTGHFTDIAYTCSRAGV